MENEHGKYLMFSLGEEHYGIPILKVNEIIGMMAVTHVPQTPKAIKGIINLRGKIIPIMDLRLKFSMDERAYDEQTCIVIVETTNEKNKGFVGIIIDKVSEVVNIDSSDIEPPPSYGSDLETNFLLGVGKVKDKVVLLLDIRSIINSQELIQITNGEVEESFEEAFAEQEVINNMDEEAFVL